VVKIYRGLNFVGGSKNVLGSNFFRSQICLRSTVFGGQNFSGVQIVFG
jgi:hypothetical protein